MVWVVAVLGSILLALVSLLFAAVGSNWVAVCVAAVAALAVPVVVWLTFPETARRTLEEISALR